MADTVITTTNRPQRSIFSKGYVVAHPNSIRAYRVDPECVQLQIRREKEYVNVALTPDEVHRLIAALLDALPEGT